VPNYSFGLSPNYSFGLSQNHPFGQSPNHPFGLSLSKPSSRYCPGTSLRQVQGERVSLGRDRNGTVRAEPKRPSGLSPDHPFGLRLSKPSSR